MSGENDFTINGTTLVRYNGHEEDVTVPKNIRKIEDGAFYVNKDLKRIVLPNGLRTIGAEAFLGCTALKECALPKAVKTIGKNAFQYCESMKMIIPEEMADTSEPLSGELARGSIETTDKGLASLIIYQRTALWKMWLKRTVFEYPSEILKEMQAIISENGLNDKTTAGITVEFIRRHLGSLQPEQIRQILSLFDQKKCKVITEFFEEDTVKTYLAGEAVDENPIEGEARELLDEIMSETGPIDKIDNILGNNYKYLNVHYCDSKTVCSRDVLKAIIYCYAKEWKRCATKHVPMDVDGVVLGNSVEMLDDGCIVKINSKADALAASLDPDELSACLDKLIKWTQYRMFLLAWARYATEQSVQTQSDEYTGNMNGRANQQYFAENMREALMISDKHAAMQFFDRIEMLDKYAAMRNKTALELRDTVMIPDLRLDENGIRKFDTGDNVIEAGIGDDLHIRMFDTAKKKEIRSFPKKGNNPKKLASATEEFTRFKKNTEDFIRQRSEQLLRMHLSGEKESAELWKSVYLQHPVIKHLADKVVWKDNSGKTFTICEGKTIDVSAADYEPAGDIHVAHVLEMTLEEVSCWQNMLAERGLVQLFEQIWEPIMDWDAADVSDRYRDVTITTKERNRLKEDLKKRGIDVYSDEMDRTYNARTMRYEFSGYTTMHVGHHLLIDYSVDPETKDLTFASARMTGQVNEKEINAVMLEMDKTAVVSFIEKDRFERMTRERLDRFTVSQIKAFIDMAIKKKAINCRSILMDYNNEHYPGYVETEEFVLEW